MTFLGKVPLSLLARTLALSLGCLGVACLALLLWETHRLTAAHDEAALRDAQRLVTLLSTEPDPARPLAGRVATGIHEARRVGLERAVLEAGRYLEIFDTDGRVLYRSPNLLGQPLEPPYGTPLEPGGWRAEAGQVRAPGGPPHRLRLLTLWPARDGPILRIAYYTDGIRRELVGLALRLTALGLPAALLLAAAFTWTVSRRSPSAVGRPEAAGQDPLHDLHTSLNILRGEVEVTLQRPRSAESYRAALSSVLDEAVALSDVVDRLHDTPRARSGPADAEPIVLADILRHTIRRLRPLALLKGVRIRADLMAGVVVWGDSPALQRLFLNLLENAIRFTPRSDEVDVRLVVTTGEAQVVVEDTGPGIPDADLSRIFERGFRGTSEGGWGLGLSIALAIARAHGGTIEAANRPGAGARILVRLPLREGTVGPSTTMVLVFALTMALGTVGVWAAAAPTVLPLGLPQDALRLPPGGAPSPTVVDLGRRLFFDAGLSVNGTVSCSSCHLPEHAFADPRRFSVGAIGRSPRRHTPTLVNRAFGTQFFWDGREESLERLVLQVLELPVAMANRVSIAVEQLSRDEGYRRAFVDALGAPPTAHSLATALAAYMRTIYSGGSPFDRFEAGEKSALSPAARRGLALFRGRAACAQCHSGFNFTDEAFHNTGVGLYDPTPDLGRYVVTNREEDKAAFKTPTLRDVARRPPYMHDGSLPTLEAVIAYYDRGGTKNPYLDPRIQPLGLSQAEQADIVAFLRSLTGSPIRPGGP